MRQTTERQQPGKVEPNKQAWLDVETQTETLLEHVQEAQAEQTAENLKPNPSPRLVREELQKDRFRVKLDALAEARANGNNELVADLLNEIFLFERSKPHFEVLKDHSRPDILAKKRELIAELRSSGVYILEKGAIEAYYPDTVNGPDKPSKAQSFCAKVSSREDGVALCEQLNIEGEQVPELDVVFGGVFGG
jgi:hypothetical protein